MEYILPIVNVVVPILSMISLTMSLLMFMVTLGETTVMKSEKSSIDLSFDTKLGNTLKAKSFFDYLMRIFDFIFVLIGVVVLSPIYLAIAMAVKIEIGGPVLRRDKIIGLYGKEVELYAFRTLKFYESGGELHYTVPPFGRFLQRTEMNHLPYFFGILQGKLALFGLAKIDSEDVLEIQQYIPEIKEAYNYYRPGLVSLSTLRWQEAIRIYEPNERYSFIHSTNMEFLHNRSCRFVFKMWCRVMYILFKPIEDENINDSQISGGSD